MIRRARLVIGIQLLLGVATLALAAIGYAGERDPLALVAVLLLAPIGLSQALPALLAVVLLRRDRASAGLLVSGASAFVPGVMIVFLTLTGGPTAAAWLVVAFGALLTGLGFHQLLMRSRLR